MSDLINVTVCFFKKYLSQLNVIDRRKKIIFVLLVFLFVGGVVFLSSLIKVGSNELSNKFLFGSTRVRYGLVSGSILNLNTSIKGEIPYKGVQFSLVGRVKSVIDNGRKMRVCFPKYLFGIDWCVDVDVYITQEKENKLSIFRINSDLNEKKRNRELIVLELSDLRNYLKNNDEVLLKFQYIKDIDYNKLKDSEIWKNNQFRSFLRSSKLVYNLRETFERGNVFNFIRFNITRLLGQHLYAMEIDII